MSPSNTRQLHSRFTTALLIVLGCFFCLQSGNAQAVKSAFVGTVRDESGAIVVGAKIEVKNLATNNSISVSTNQDGEYVVPFLDPGTYSVSATAPGFKVTVEPHVTLDVTAQVRVDLMLRVGNSSQHIEVSSAAPLVEADTSSLGMVVTTEKLEQLPLLGRNYQQLSQLAPMAVAPAGNQGVPGFTSGGLTAGTYYQVGGQRGSFMNYIIDGLDNNNIAWQTVGILPSLDAIDEFKIQDHNFSAEYGRGTIEFITTTKQGTNQLHGSIYEYVRNDVFNANSFFNNRSNIAKTPFRYNQFGVTVGGPIMFPTIYNGKNKTFFFFGYEGTRYVQTTTAFATWPNPAWLTGNFSSIRNTNGTTRVIYNPYTTVSNGAGGYTRSPFAGNVIPATLIDPVAAKLAAFVPQPGTLTGGALLPSGSNTTVSEPTRSNPNNWVGRVDHTFSEKDRMYGRYMESLENITVAGIAPLSGNIGVHNGYNAMLAETHVFSPTLVNEFRAGYNRSTIETDQEDGLAGCIGPCPANRNIVQQVGLQNLIGASDPADYGLPFISWTGYTSLGPNVSRPLIPLVHSYQASDNVVKMLGSHTLKFGVNYERTWFDYTSESYARGSFNFTGQFTQSPVASQAGSSGSPVADFLLGLSATSSGLSGNVSGPYGTGNQGYYFQDDWRVNSKLTLNLGLRWEFYHPFVALRDNENSQFAFGSVPGSCFGANCPPGHIVEFQKGQEFYAANWNDWGPRIGFAYSPFGDNKTVIRASYGTFYTPTDSTDSGTWGLNNPPTSLLYTLTPNNPYTDLTTTKMGNLFPSNTIPPLSSLVTNNWPLPGLALMTDTIGTEKDATVYEWQMTVQREIHQDMVLEIGYSGSHGIHGSNLVDDNQARLDAPGVTTPLTSRLPYPSLSSQLTVSEHAATSKYEAGFLRFEKRYRAGLSIVSAYTFARTEENYGNKNGAGHWWAQDAYNLGAEFGLSAYDAKHRFTAGYVWQVPIGRGQHWGHSMNKALDAVIGGWQISGITTFQSGSPWFALTNKDWSNTGILNGPAGGGRPNCLAPVQYEDPRATLMWFNPASFAVPAMGTFGNCGTGALYGPGIENWDLTGGKNFHLRENVVLQIRAEMFNAFNHTQFTSASQTFTIDPSLTPIQEAGLSATLPPRNIQFAARIQF